MRITHTIILFAALVVGCSAQYAATHGLLTSATTHVEAAIPHSDAEGRQHLNAAVKDIARADAQSGKDAQAYTDLQTTYDREHNSTWAKAGRTIHRIAWGIVGALGAAFAMRLASQFVGGWVGTSFSLASTAIFGVATGGISIIQSIFDHHYLLRAKARLNGGNDGTATAP